MKDKISGIYCIENLINNKKYIGYSNHIYRRWSEHRSDLKYNKHENEYLQKSYNLHGKDNFIYYIIEKCPIDMLFILEKYYIFILKTTNRNFGYNLAEGGLGILMDHRPEEWGRNISKAKTGKKNSEEHIENMRLSRLGMKLSEECKNKLRYLGIGMKKAKISQSEYVGVCHSQNKFRVWKSYIAINRKQEFLGSYITEIEAAKAYDKRCFEICHDLLKLNFPQDYFNEVWLDPT